MQIAHWFQAIIAVLGFAAVFSQLISNESLMNNNTLSESRTRRSLHKRQFGDSGQDSYSYQHANRLTYPGVLLSQRDNQKLLRHESKNGSGVDCCPSVLEMIEPKGGKNQDDIYVELYRDGDLKQRFYELSCHEDILNKPCRFMDRKLHEHSRCVQKYSYTYALVKDPGRHHHQRPKNFPTFPAAGPGGTSWMLDYIRVRSGCGCVVTPNKKKRDRQNKFKKHKNPADEHA